MDDFIDVEMNMRDLKISCRVVEKLQSIESESRKRGMNTSFLWKLQMIAAYFRKSPDYVLMYLEPILEMVKNNINPGVAFVLFDDYQRIEFMAKMDAETSVKKRKAQNKRMDAIQEKRETFAKIKQKWDIEKNKKTGKSLKELLAASFPMESEDERKFTNLCQQYYRTIRGEVGVEKEKIADMDFVFYEFLNCYLLDHAGVASEHEGFWSYLKLREQFGKARSRIDRILSQRKYKQKFLEYLAAQLTKKKKKS